MLRAQVFTGDALSHVAFTGALAALAFGVDPRLGLFAATIAVAAALGALGRRGPADDVVIGTVFAWVLGLGVFFLTIYTTSRSTANGTAGVDRAVRLDLRPQPQPGRHRGVVAAGVCVALLLIARPLLFASIDEAVAAARGVPVRLLGYRRSWSWSAPARPRPPRPSAPCCSSACSPPPPAPPTGSPPARTVGLALVGGPRRRGMWAGLAFSYARPALPPSFAILAVATGSLRDRPRRQHPPGPSNHDHRGLIATTRLRPATPPARRPPAHH